MHKGESVDLISFKSNRRQTLIWQDFLKSSQIGSCNHNPMWWSNLKLCGVFFSAVTVNQVSISKYTFLSRYYENNLKLFKARWLCITITKGTAHLLVLLWSMEGLVWSPLNISNKGWVHVVIAHENSAKY